MKPKCTPQRKNRSFSPLGCIKYTQPNPPNHPQARHTVNPPNGNQVWYCTSPQYHIHKVSITRRHCPSRQCTVIPNHTPTKRHQDGTSSRRKTPANTNASKMWTTCHDTISRYMKTMDENCNSKHEQQNFTIKNKNKNTHKPLPPTSLTCPPAYTFGSSWAGAGEVWWPPTHPTTPVKSICAHCLHRKSGHRGHRSVGPDRKTTYCSTRGAVSAMAAMCCSAGTALCCDGGTTPRVMLGTLSRPALTRTFFLRTNNGPFNRAKASSHGWGDEKTATISNLPGTSWRGIRTSTLGIPWA